MANPLILIALAGGALFFLAKKPEAKSAPAQTPILPPTPAGSQTVQVPGITLPGVAPQNQPTVSVTVPASASPGIAQQTVPVGVAKFPDLPGVTSPAATPVVLHPTGDKTDQYPPTPQQVLTQAAQTAAQTVQTVLTPPVAVQVQETAPALDPNGTVELAAKLINAESAANWKTALASDVKFWQSKVGLTQDGKFGPKSAVKMAELVGVLPLVRYFPAASASKAAALKAYRDQLYTAAANLDNHNPAQAAAVRASAAYEQGQGWATNPPAIPSSQRLAQATVLNAALKA